MPFPNVLYIILDSCRFDSFHLADTPNFDSIGQVEARTALGAWTVPAMSQVFLGHLPHKHGQSCKLQIPEIRMTGHSNRPFFGVGLPHEEGTSLLLKLKEHGYFCQYYGALPPMWYYRPMREDFDAYEHVCWFDDIAGQIQWKEPTFAVCHCIETHELWWSKQHKSLPGEVWERGIDHWKNGLLDSRDRKVLRECHRMQSARVQGLDKTFGQMLPSILGNTQIKVFSDHGEAFGEDGYLGHGCPIGPVMTVPFLEGKKT